MNRTRSYQTEQNGIKNNKRITWNKTSELNENKKQS